MFDTVDEWIRSADASSIRPKIIVSIHVPRRKFCLRVKLSSSYFDSRFSSFKVAFNGMTNGSVKAADVYIVTKEAVPTFARIGSVILIFVYKS